MSEDPVFLGDPNQQNLQNPQSLNSYSYGENNPIVKKDAEGREATDETRGVLSKHGPGAHHYPRLTLTPEQAARLDDPSLRGQTNITLGAYNPDFWHPTRNTLQKAIGTADTSEGTDFKMVPIQKVILISDTVSGDWSDMQVEQANRLIKAFKEVQTGNPYWTFGTDVDEYDPSGNSNNFSYTVETKAGFKYGALDKGTACSAEIKPLKEFRYSTHGWFLDPGYGTLLPDRTEYISSK